jgi:phosphoglycerol transferase MdoB-like AlkP superfamily enzyme
VDTEPWRSTRTCPSCTGGRTSTRIFGFDDFVYDKRMHVDERIGHDAWISDDATFQELMLTLRREEKPALVNVVTMQNHMPYDGRYADPVHVTGPDGEPLPAVGQYLRGLRHSDQAVENLVHRLSRSKEGTLVVFYGDHLPSVYPQSVIEENSWRVRHQTPFFVWADFPGAVRTPYRPRARSTSCGWRWSARTRPWRRTTG